MTKLYDVYLLTDHEIPSYYEAQRSQNPTIKSYMQPLESNPIYNMKLSVHYSFNVLPLHQF
jgi:hypothetical protein